MPKPPEEPKISRFEKKLIAQWYNNKKVSLWQSILEPVYSLVISIKQSLYKHAVFSTEKLPVKIVVVGNISVGGTGKSPLLMALYKHLSVQGVRVGVISKGYGRKSRQTIEVQTNSQVSECGDEPCMMRKAGVKPVFVGASRVDSVVALLKQYDVDLILSDDGLQDYSFHHDVELLVVDAERGFGNQRMLPAGPLREPLSRINSTDLVICQGINLDISEYSFKLEASCWKALGATKGEPDTSQVFHAIAGIGHPQRFFNTLESMGFTIIRHSFPDHHKYSRQDFEFNDNLGILMTEKDAVKCHGFDDLDMWSLQVEAKLQPKLIEKINQLLIIDRNKNKQE
ncbi:MAG: tetraacyldisaccharide 4'-kinase [bacterium]